MLRPEKIAKDLAGSQAAHHDGEVKSQSPVQLRKLGGRVSEEARPILGY